MGCCCWRRGESPSTAATDEDLDSNRRAFFLAGGIGQVGVVQSSWASFFFGIVQVLKNRLLSIIIRYRYETVDDYDYGMISVRLCV